MTSVTYREWLEARRVFMSLCSEFFSIVYFDEYVGITLPFPEWYHPDHSFNTTDAEAARVRYMLGPHAHTIFKAWMAKRNDRQRLKK